jgi:hypothetical protein
VHVQTAVATADSEQTKRQHGWPKGVSGNPAGARVRAERVAELFESMAADVGGADALSVVDRALVMQACQLLARAERAKSTDAVVRLTSEARRLVRSLRKRAPAAKAPGQSLAEYLAANHGPAPQDAPADSAAPEGAATEARMGDDLPGTAEPSDEAPG